MRIRLAPLAAAAVLLLPAARAPAVSISEAREVEGGVIFRSHAGEIHFVTRDGARATIIGRVPRRASRLVGDGEEAWSYLSPWDRPTRLFVVRGAAFAEVLPEIDPAAGPPAGLAWVTGCDASFVYLLGGDGRRARLDRATSRIEPGHLDAHPDLTVVATRRAHEGHVLLARDDASPPQAWLVREPGARVALSRPMTDFTRFGGGDEALVVSMTGTLLVVDPCTLEVRADLTDVKPAGPALFASADADAAWVDARLPSGRRAHWRIDLATREAVEVGVPAGRERHELVADDGEHLWFARIAGPGASAAPFALAKAGGEVARLNLNGPPGSGLRVVPRALKGGAAVVLYLPVIVAGALGGGY